MRGIRGLLVACTVAASVAVPLALPSAALADSLAMGPMVAIVGAVESRPVEGIAGEWAVDGTLFVAVESTRLIEAAGPAEVGAQVAVLAWQVSDGSLQAYIIRVQSPAQAARLQSLMAQVRSALGLTTRLRLHTQSQLQTQTQNQSQDCTQQQTQTQTRQQSQTQAQQQWQDCTQQGTGTQTRSRPGQ